MMILTLIYKIIYLIENILSTAHKLVHFGWKKEAIPISETKKTLIRRLLRYNF